MDFLESLQLILIVLKFFKIIDISWWWVFTPLYITIILALLIGLFKGLGKDD